MSAYRDLTAQPTKLLVCCGVCPHRQCRFHIGVCEWNEVHPAGISSDFPKGTGVLVNDGTDQNWLTVEQMKKKLAGTSEDQDE